GGTGTAGANYDLQLIDSGWERAFQLRTTNAAAFAEELVHVTDRLSVVPGIRIESVRSSTSGYTDVSSSFTPHGYAYPLGGIGASYLAGESTDLYANVSQAYRPILYSSLTPLGSVARISPDLHSSRGANADLGWRGFVADAIKFDLGVFYLWYGDRIG